MAQRIKAVDMMRLMLWDTFHASSVLLFRRAFVSLMTSMGRIIVDVRRQPLTLFSLLKLVSEQDNWFLKYGRSLSIYLIIVMGTKITT